MNENRSEIDSGFDPDANGLHNHDGNDFTDALIEFIEQQQSAIKGDNDSKLRESGNDLGNDTFNEKSTCQRDFEENNLGLDDFFDDKDLKEDTKQQNNWGFKR